MKTLDESFDPRNNGLNLLRLVLASLVILTHAAVVTTGSREPRGIFDVLVGQLPVDGFFAISGFLIAGSWLKNPEPLSFLISRLGRLYPAYWACLLVTALAIAPLSVFFSPAGAPSDVNWGESWEYVARNASIVVFQHDIEGTLENVPYPGDWNASLWTLKWEMACYLGVLILGMLGMMNRLWVHVSAFTLASAISVCGSLIELPKFIDDATRFFLMYEAGIVVLLVSRWLPIGMVWLGASGFVVLLTAWTLPDYRSVAALPLAYVLIGSGALLKQPIAQIQNDISYGMYVYGFPVEQLLAHTQAVGLTEVAFAATATFATLPIAALSWFVVERPTLHAIRRWRILRSSPEQVQEYQR